LNGPIKGYLSFKNSVLLKTIQASVFALLGIFAFLATYCIYARLFYPFELDWIEGEVICHIFRLLEGKRLYPPPSFTFISEIYPPFYYFIAALISKITGVGFFPGRCVSIISCGAIIVLMYQSVFRETNTRRASLISCGLFIACYYVNGPWYDLARVDMLFFFLIFSGFYVLAYFQNDSWGIPCSVCIFLLACYTKQNALMYVPFACLYLLTHDKIKAAVFMLLFSVFLVFTFFIFNSVSDGWLGKYTVTNLIGYKENLTLNMPNSYVDLIHEIREKLPSEIRFEICFKLPVFFTCLFCYLFFRFISVKHIKDISLWEYAAVAGACTYFIVRPHPGSEKNDLINLTLWGCILWGIMLKPFDVYKNNDFSLKLHCSLYALLIIQLCLLLYNPADVLPHASSEKKGREFIDMVRNTKGDVFIPYHSFYAVMAGKKMIFNAGAFWGYQLLSSAAYDAADIIDKINQKYFTAIIIDDKSFYTWLGQRVAFNNIDLLLSADEPLSQAIAKNYVVSRKIDYTDIDEFRNPTGFMTRPEIILKPR